MKRALTLLLSLAIVTAAVATPAVECAGAATVGSQHECCGEQAITFAPGGPCCFLSRPAGDRALTSSRAVSAPERHAASHVTGSARLALAQTYAQRRPVSTLLTGPPPVPIYIQHLSLLI